MPTTITSILALVFILLPGFVAVETMRMIFSYTGVANREETKEKLIFKYAGWGVACNVVLSLVTLSTLGQDLHVVEVQEYLDILKSARVIDVLLHGAALTLFAASLGVVWPCLYELGLSRFAGRLGVNFATGARDVFHGHMNSIFRTKANRWKPVGDKSRLVPWVVFSTEAKSRFLGRLRRSNTEISDDGPIEMVFCPLFRVTAEGTLQEVASIDGAEFTGLYGRLESRNVIYIYKARQDFLPRQGDRLSLPDAF